MGDNQCSSAEDHSSVGVPLESGSPGHRPKEVSSQAPSCGLNNASPFEDLTSRMEQLSFARSWLPFMSWPRNSPASDAKMSRKAFSDRESQHGRSYDMRNFLDELSSRRRNVSVGTINEFLTSEMEENSYHETQHSMEELRQLNGNLSRQGEEAQFESGPSSTIEADDEAILLSYRSYGDKCIGNVLPRVRDEQRCFRTLSLDGLHQVNPLSEDLVPQQRVVDIANQILKDIAGVNPDAEYTNLEDYLSRNGISEKYWGLYTGRRPANYDFAMNIMAHVEFLNDDSWVATLSYFDVNVKRMIKDIWTEKIVGFNDKIDLKTFNCDMVLKVMVDYTQSSTVEDFDLGQFLDYCVIMCQLGVQARKSVFTDAPLYAIRQIRDRIKSLKLEDFVQIMFEIVVKEYAQRYVEHSRE